MSKNLILLDLNISETNNDREWRLNIHNRQCLDQHAHGGFFTATNDRSWEMVLHDPVHVCAHEALPVAVVEGGRGWRCKALGTGEVEAERATAGHIGPVSKSRRCGWRAGSGCRR